MDVEESFGALPPAVVFGRRLREWRERRRLTQAQLAELATEAGRPMTRQAVLTVERGERRVTLDEALALAYVLEASPASLLTSPSGHLALTDHLAIDGATLRDFLLTGVTSPWFPAEPTPENREQADRTLEELLVRYALLLVDSREAEDKAGMAGALRSILDVVRQYREAIDDA